MSTVLLALDTTTDACSAAVAVGAERFARRELSPNRHSARILPLIEEVLAAAGIGRGAIDAIAFCRGPGPFTGVRIAAGVAQGLGLALDRPLLPVSTLATLAMGAFRRDGADRVLTAIDARMDEVYAGAFRRDAAGLPALVGAERVCAPEALAIPEAGRWFGAGSGSGASADRPAGTLAPLAAPDPARLPEALDILPIALAALDRGEAVAPEAAVPVYLRDRVTR